MSNSYSIGCTQCKKSLWIAQGGLPESFTFYSGEPVIMFKLKQFLREHIHHPLLFFDSSNSEEVIPDFFDMDDDTGIDTWERLE